MAPSTNVRFERADGKYFLLVNTSPMRSRPGARGRLRLQVAGVGAPYPDHRILTVVDGGRMCWRQPGPARAQVVAALDPCHRVSEGRCLHVL